MKLHELITELKRIESREGGDIRVMLVESAYWSAGLHHRCVEHAQVKRLAKRKSHHELDADSKAGMFAVVIG